MHKIFRSAENLIAYQKEDGWPNSYSDALRLSNVVLFGQDAELHYLWVENHPQGLTTLQLRGCSEDEFMPLTAAQAVFPAKREVLNTGKPRTIEFQWPIGDSLRWYELRIDAVRDTSGRVVGLNCAAIDISERKQSESHLRVLLLELAHRSKNLLAVIQGICNQTAKSSTNVEEFNRRFSGRLLSLSRAHDILSDQNWRGAGMHELIRTQVLLFAGAAANRIHFEGEHIYLRPNAAQHLGLALHELTSNALKYGALANDVGQIRVRWGVSPSQPQAQFALSWQEERGPPVRTPETRHFGRILLEEVAPRSVQGTASLEFAGDGVRYHISMPVSEIS
jgi:two-component sensor histidine kinase